MFHDVLGSNLGSDAARLCRDRGEVWVGYNKIHYDFRYFFYCFPYSVIIFLWALYLWIEDVSETSNSFSL